MRLNLPAPPGEAGAARVQPVDHAGKLAAPELVQQFIEKVVFTGPVAGAPHLTVKPGLAHSDLRVEQRFRARQAEHLEEAQLHRDGGAYLSRLRNRLQQ